MLRIRPEQLKVLEESSLEIFQERLIIAIHRKSGVEEVKADLHTKIARMIESAIAAGFRTERSVADYVMERIT